MERCDVAIIGGGPVGAVLGALLRRGSRSPLSVVLLERHLPSPVPASQAQGANAIYVPRGLGSLCGRRIMRSRPMSGCMYGLQAVRLVKRVR